MHCKSSRQVKDFPAVIRFISRKGHIYCPIKSRKGRLSNGRYLWRMRKYAAYRIIPRIHYERMVADESQAFSPDAP